MTASDNDVYIKSMDGFADEMKQTHSEQQIAALKSTHTTPHKALQLPLIKTETDSAPPGVIGWGTSFERLLEDPAGLHTFAEFLKKEFSAENIYFWTACERYRHMDNDAERAAQALAIFSKHLANGSLEPVNVDSQARNLTEEKLRSAERDIFAHAQKQIFNLMKFDSYQRFIRSDLYKSCLDAEQKHQPLQFNADNLDELLKTNFHQNASSKLKKSASNAEDRRRKSLLPWHRKTRSKSRDRNELLDAGKSTHLSLHAPSKLPQLTGSSSLKIPSTQNSMSDLHSSRSSLSSFDALPSAVQSAEVSCSLCRVILSNGATTIVQTRTDETVGQLVERLLEKRGLTYKFYDVVANGSTKSIDLQSPAQILAGKEVLIEQRVAFKLDLPDPKVISVKSKPKKQLHEVIRPILHKYNYSMEAVRVLLRDTHAQLDLSLPVTVADGQRLQIVLLNPPAPDYQNSCTGAKFVKPLPKSISFPGVSKPLLGSVAPRNGFTVGAAAATPGAAPQSTLDEITNKVFNELLQGKVEAHAGSNKQQQQQQAPTKEHDLCSLKSDDCASETSSIFERIRSRRDSSVLPVLRLKTKKKSTSSQHSEETNQSKTNQPQSTTTTAAAAMDIKKPLIAKLKAGVKLQVTERVAENQEELLEGLKRAQLARLEDQRGTEINFELPDFLKNKENLSAAASKLRKMRANLSPVSKAFGGDEQQQQPQTPPTEYPQPAPRLSIAHKYKSTTVSPMKIDEEPTSPIAVAPLEPYSASSSSLDDGIEYAAGCKGPPPLPPKPKVLPIKPSNWGVATTAATASPTTPPVTNIATTPLGVSLKCAAAGSASKIPIDIARKASLQSAAAAIEQTASATTPTSTRCAYLEEPSSSFV